VEGLRILLVLSTYGPFGGSRLPTRRNTLLRAAHVLTDEAQELAEGERTSSGSGSSQNKPARSRSSSSSSGATALLGKPSNASTVDKLSGLPDRLSGRGSIIRVGPGTVVPTIIVVPP
jgi:hypothetical protein